MVPVSIRISLGAGAGKSRRVGPVGLRARRDYTLEEVWAARAWPFEPRTSGGLAWSLLRMLRKAAPKAVDKSGRRVRSMFASIAGKYDLLNHLLSLNIDKSWRTFTTRTVPPVAGVPVLDCCTGTADLALEYHKAGGGRSPVVGSDFCHEMLVIGNRKVVKAKADASVALIEGDTQRLPLPDNTFGRGHGRFRAPERRRHGPGDRRDGPRRPTRAARWRSSNSLSPAGPCSVVSI